MINFSVYLNRHVYVMSKMKLDVIHIGQVSKKKQKKKTKKKKKTQKNKQKKTKKKTTTTKNKQKNKQKQNNKQVGHNGPISLT